MHQATVTQSVEFEEAISKPSLNRNISQEANANQRLLQLYNVFLLLFRGAKVTFSFLTDSPDQLAECFFSPCSFLFNLMLVLFLIHPPRFCNKLSVLITGHNYIFQ